MLLLQIARSIKYLRIFSKVLIGRKQHKVLKRLFQCAELDIVLEMKIYIDQKVKSELMNSKELNLKPLGSKF